MEKIRVGVIGTGYGSSVHLPSYQQHHAFEVTAVCARTEESARRAAEKFDIKWWTTDYEALCASDRVDVVSIASPPGLHYDMAMAALQNGKHAVVEVGFTCSYEQAKALAEKAQETDLIGVPAFVLRFAPARRYVTKLIQKGYLGEPRLARFDFLAGMLNNPGFPYGWLMDKEAGGGMMAGFGSHAIDSARLWIGEFAAVDAMLTNFVSDRFDPEVGRKVPVTADDTCLMNAVFSSGALGQFMTTGVAHMGRSGVQLYGSNGTLALDHTATRVLGARAGAKALSELPIPPAYRSEIEGPKGLLGGFMQLIDRLADGIRTGQQPAPSFADGVAVQRVLDAAARSSKSGRRIYLNSQ
ncbi:MAG: Gfo/Idh/MocA family protein [Anaerolineae bacterium]